MAGCGVASRSPPSTMTGKAPCHENMSAVPYAPNNKQLVISMVVSATVAIDCPMVVTACVLLE